MVSTVVRKGAFSGSGGIWGKDGLEAVMRSLLQDKARQALSSKSIAAITDNSTGVAANASDVTPYPPNGPFNAMTAGGVQLTGFNASCTKILAAEKTFSTAINNVLNMLGLPPLTNLEGAAGTANTIAALDKAAITASGTAAVDFDSYVATANALKTNIRTLTYAFGAIATAFGVPAPVLPFMGSTPASSNIKARPMVITPAAVASATGNPSVALADGSAFLTAMANDYAALAAGWNAIFTASTGSLYTAPSVSVVAG